MARIRLGGIVSDIQGSIGGTIFQNTSAGLIARNKSTNINKLSSSQINRRNITSGLQAQWMSLTSAQRIEWEAFTKYNPIKQKNISNRFINGQQTFLLINYYRVLYSINILVSPVFFPYLHDPVTVSFSNPLGVLRLTLSDGTLSTTSYLILFVTTTVTASLNNAGNRFRLLVFNLLPGVTQNISPVYISVFGIIPVTNQYIFAKWSIGDKTTGIIQPFQSGKFKI